MRSTYFTGASKQSRKNTNNFSEAKLKHVMSVKHGEILFAGSEICLWLSNAQPV
jgi:hypothetical protein